MAVAAAFATLGMLAAVPSGEAANPDIETVSPLVVGGQTGFAGDFPFLVAVGDKETFLMEGMGSAHFCGGALVARTKVLTAAHCVAGLKPRDIVVAPMPADGSLDGITQAWQASKAEVHPDYDPRSNRFDLAVLTTRQAVFGPIAQVASPLQDSLLEAGAPVALGGWGAVSSDGKSYPDTFMSGSLQMVSARDCSQGGYVIDGVSFSGWGAKLLADSMVCAAGVRSSNVVDACMGDSGGPLVSRLKAAYTVVGVVSWGAKRCGAPVAGVYSDVSKSQDWLRQAGVPMAGAGEVQSPFVLRVERFVSSARVVAVVEGGDGQTSAVSVVTSQGQGCSVVVDPESGEGSCTVSASSGSSFAVRTKATGGPMESAWSPWVQVSPAVKPFKPKLALSGPLSSASATLLLSFNTGSWSPTAATVRCTSPGHDPVEVRPSDGVPFTVAPLDSGTVYFCRAQVTTSRGTLHSGRLRFETL